MTRLVIVASLTVATMLAAAALRLPADGATVVERPVVIEAPALVVDAAEPALPPPAAPVPVITPTPASDTAGACDIGHRPPPDCSWMPEAC